MEKGNPWALLPIAVFLVVFIGSGIIFQDFYAMPDVYKRQRDGCLHE